MKNKLFAVAIFTAAFGLAGVASAFTFDSKIDTLQEKKDVQTVLNMATGSTLTVDGVLGAKSIAAVKAFQTLKGLTVDGKIGPMTRAALTAASTGTTTGTTLPAGCQAGWAFNPATGASCSTTSPAVVTGGAGTMSVSEISTDVENKITEGQADVKGLGFKVEANDSDVKVTNMKISLNKVNTASGSNYLDRYASSVSVWMNGTKLATVSAADFNKDSTGNYSKSIAFDAVVKEGSSNKATFYVTTTGVSNIDSLDMSKDWYITASDFRFQDGTGVIMTYLPLVTPVTASNNTLTNTLTSSDITASGDVKLSITKGSGTPVAGNVKISSTSSTSDIPMLEVKIKNTGADMTFDTLTFNVQSSATLSSMVGELVLKEGSTELASVSSFAATTALTAVNFELDETYTLPKDSTKTFTLYAKINDVDNFGQGKTLVANYVKTDFEVASTRTSFKVADQTGSANGEVQTFFSEGLNASAFTKGAITTSTNGSTGKMTANFPVSFKLTAFGNTYYVQKNGLAINTVSGGSISAMSSSASADGNYWVLNDGDTATFTATGVVSSPATSDFYKISLKDLVYSADAVAGSDSTYTFSPATSYETDSTYITN